LLRRVLQDANSASVYIVPDPLLGGVPERPAPVPLLHVMHMEGLNLSDFIKRGLDRTVERPSMREWLESSSQARPIPAKRSAAQIVRRMRGRR
jgi:hypothetical protein